MKPVTWASISNCKKTSVRAATTISFALLLALAAGPVRSRSGEGSSYMESLESISCSGLAVLAGTGTALGGIIVATGTSTVNSSSKLSSSNSSSSLCLFHSATTGVSNGGVSVISNSSSLRSGRLELSQVAVFLIRVITDETGVAVVTNKPKQSSRINTGYANTSVINTTSGCEIP